EERSSVRTWLYRIATNRCLNHLRADSRREVALPSGVPAPSSLGELTWLQPLPDALLADLPDAAPGPDAQYESRYAITLAFITAAQSLPPRQRAVLRDVLGYRGRETAELTGMTVEAVNGALKRARQAMDARSAGPSRALAHTAVDDELVGRFVEAFIAFDVAAMVALMSDDVWLRMPPMPFEYFGREAARQFFTAIARRRSSPPVVVMTGANTQPAWAEYREDPVHGLLHLTGLEVLTISEGRISQLIRFESAVAPWFGLPRTLNSRPDSTKENPDG
ncbi:MAG: RNA polymerase subunit sigma-70, partial [bacterium]|nr:RNA polymerase subunit sigma-70 [bacterium]